MRRIRLLHLYIGLFFTPSILFFAVSGALQSVEMHEVKKDIGYQPPRWIEVLAQVHKHQTTEVRPRPAAPPAVAQGNQQNAAAGGTPVRPPARVPRPEPWPLRAYFAFVACGLIVTSILGVVMAFKYNRDRLVLTGLLIGGTLLPLLLLAWKV